MLDPAGSPFEFIAEPKADEFYMGNISFDEAIKRESMRMANFNNRVAIWAIKDSLPRHLAWMGVRMRGLAFLKAIGLLKTVSLVCQNGIYVGYLPYGKITAEHIVKPTLGDLYPKDFAAGKAPTI